jgi:hypothetical protein
LISSGHSSKNLDMSRVGVLVLALLAVFPVSLRAAGRRTRPKQVGSLGPFLANSRVIPIDVRKGVVHRGRLRPLDRGQPSTFAVALIDMWTPANVARVMEGGGRSRPLTTFVMLDDGCLTRTDIFEGYPAHYFLAPRDSPLRAWLTAPGNYTCEAGKCTQDFDSSDFEKKNPPFE